MSGEPLPAATGARIEEVERSRTADVGRDRRRPRILWLTALARKSTSGTYSRVYEALRGDTGRAKLVTALLSAAALLLAPEFRNLPRAGLAAVVIGAVVEGVNWSAPAKVWRFSRRESFLLGVELVGVLGLGLVPGMLLAVGLSILVLLHDAARPHTAWRGNAPGWRRRSAWGRNA